MRKSCAALLATLAIVLAAGPAWAHEEINPSTITTGKPTFFTLNAANEKEVALTNVTLRAPKGTPFGEATHQPAGWTVDHTADTIKWSGGSVAPANFEEWGFEIEGADQPGALTFGLTLGFANGSNENVNVVVTAVAAGSTAQPTVTAGGRATTVTTGAGAATSTPATTEAAVGEKDSDSNGLGIAAVAVAAIAFVLAGIALAQGRRGGAAAAPSSAAPSDKKDW